MILGWSDFSFFWQLEKKEMMVSKINNLMIVCIGCPFFDLLSAKRDLLKSANYIEILNEKNKLPIRLLLFPLLYLWNNPCLILIPLFRYNEKR